MKISRRIFLQYCLGVLASAAAACTNPLTDRNAPTSAIAPEPPGPFTATIEGEQQVVEAVASQKLVMTWSGAANAHSYDIELNGVLVAEDVTVQRLNLGFGHASVGFQEGVNSYRVRARNDVGERWSDIETFEVTTLDGIRARHFDYEDDGDIRLTVASEGSAMTVASHYAFGARGKGVALRCFDSSDTRAYKNHVQLPVEECWMRVAIRPEMWERDDVRINIARIRSAEAKANEYLIWRTGVGLRSTSVTQDFRIPHGEWSQAQLGVKADGTVELWVFDGRREFLVGRRVNEGLIGRGKDIVSIGNNSPSKGITYEIWLDEFVVSERRIPWARIDDTHELVRPEPLDPAKLPPVFSFIFGSCNSASRVPYKNSALKAAADMEPDFMIHLGDYCYPDSAAYAQSKQGYLALWSDLLYEQQLSRLSKIPWIYVASDHDLGGNNIDTESLSPFALDAFTTWGNNSQTVDGIGKYGSLEFDEGHILLIWIDAISFRSPIIQPDSPSKTVLGIDQKKWFMDLLMRSDAKLIIIASQTTFGHWSDTGWVQYPTEQLEVLEACKQAKGFVRWISGDHHSARRANMGDGVAEWGAAPFAAIPQSCPTPAPFVISAACSPRQVPAERVDILASLTQQEINSLTSFGRVVIDTISKSATFEVRDSRGQLRTDELGFPFAETLIYKSIP